MASKMADTETFTSNIAINCNFTSERGSISILTIGRTEPESFTKNCQQMFSEVKNL